MGISKEDKISMNTTDLYWAAGFLDGEGCFQLGGRPGHLTPRVNGYQNDPELLLRLRGLFGGSVAQRRGENAHIWTLCGPTAAGVMMTLFSLLSQKRRHRISALLKQWRTFPVRRGVASLVCQRGHLWTEATWMRTGSSGQWRTCRVCARTRGRNRWRRYYGKNQRYRVA